MNEIDAIRQRHSVRQYKADRIEDEKDALMAIGRNGEDKTPQGWADIRMFEPWDDETKRTLNPKLFKYFTRFIFNL